MSYASGVFQRLVVVSLVRQEASYKYKLSPGDLNQRSFPGPSLSSIPAGGGFIKWIFGNFALFVGRFTSGYDAKSQMSCQSKTR